MLGGALNPTCKALEEALEERDFLLQRLESIAVRNKPADWGQPVKINDFSLRFQNSGAFNYEELLSNLESSISLLERIKSANEAARRERERLTKELEDIMSNGPSRVSEALSDNALMHRGNITAEQTVFEKISQAWVDEKSNYMQDAEKWSIKSHEAQTNAHKERVKVNEMRSTITKLASELRDSLSETKRLKDNLEDVKAKLKLVPDLTEEIEANRKKADELLSDINEQRLLLSAATKSGKTNALLNDLQTQIDKLISVLAEETEKRDNCLNEYQNLVQYHQELMQRTEELDEDFRQTQMSMLAFESENLALTQSLEKIKEEAMIEGQKNVLLNRTIKQERINAAEQFLDVNHYFIFRPDIVRSAISTVREQYTPEKEMDDKSATKLSNGSTNRKKSRTNLGERAKGFSATDSTKTRVKSSTYNAHSDSVSSPRRKNSKSSTKSSTKSSRRMSKNSSSSFASSECSGKSRKTSTTTPKGSVLSSPQQSPRYHPLSAKALDDGNCRSYDYIEGEVYDTLSQDPDQLTETHETVLFL